MIPTTQPPQAPAARTSDTMDPEQAQDTTTKTAPAEADRTGSALDHLFHAAMGRFTLGMSPMALMTTWFDWASHIATAPGKQAEITQKAVQKLQCFGRYARRCTTHPPGSDTLPEPCIEPLSQDDRFRDPAWQRWPFNLIHQGFLLQQQLAHNSVTGVPGVTAEHERRLQFLTRQVLDIVSPSNFLLTNPETLRKTQEQFGLNLIRGMQKLVDDLRRKVQGASLDGIEAFRPGYEVALTPGRVIYRNRLIELIQYTPTTKLVRPEPILIVPAWIMKYYILDLSPKNSLVRYLVDQGFTVFMISWKNPDAGDRDLSLDDYRELGVMAALETVGQAAPGQRIHAAGYCLGGTLLAIAAAAMARAGDGRLASMTLLASQTDFSEAGELQLFIDESQLSFLDDMMWRQGYLDSSQMAGAFQMLRSNDLLWSRMTRDYLLGEAAPMTDLMAWNADGTRMPYRMHSDYLRKLYLNNELSTGQFEVQGRPVFLTDIRVPIFALGALKDHVAPWGSVFRIHLLTDTEVTFALTSGGHNAGVVSEPGQRHRHYQILTTTHGVAQRDPDGWLATAPQHDGSWWPAWVDWLWNRSGVSTAAPQISDDASADAPGTYALQR